jgi:hypothetical protein
MGKFCTNCGSEINVNADVCLSCGQLITTNNKGYTNQGKALATISVVFGSLGFYPLVIIGSIVGMITSIIGLNDPNNQYRGRSKIGLGLSIGSLGFWLLIILLSLAVSRNFSYYF